MKVHTFIAESAAEAVAQIRDQLGPQAVVLNVRQVPQEGLQRIWKKPRIEVLATVPETEPESESEEVSQLALLREELKEIRQRIPTQQIPPSPMTSILAVAEQGRGDYGEWKIGAVLEQTGLLPLHAQRVLERAQELQGHSEAPALQQQFELVRKALISFWPEGQNTIKPIQIFIGPPGSGKTTALCKRLAQIVLLEGGMPQVYRLDTHISNTAESLSVYCEILNVPIERFLPGTISDSSTALIDVPGISPMDSSAMEQLRQVIEQVPGAQVHLTLNSAYELPHLLKQVKAFAQLPVSDLVFTHLDEELRWGKLWNFVLGTKYLPHYLSAGQNIPGDLQIASASKIVSRQFC
ncbi:MAG: hypothetical protein SFY81_09105 [Verrucomicrobiota bacterium]|nr:hypothetical protein [Verrucomicrobiota bacterium]